MRLVKLPLPSGDGDVYVNPDRVAWIEPAESEIEDAYAALHCSGVKPLTVYRYAHEVAALLTAEPVPVPVVYVCRGCLEAVDVEAGRCAECDAEVVAVSGHESAATLLRWLGEARVERPDDDEMPFGEGE